MMAQKESRAIALLFL